MRTRLASLLIGLCLASSAAAQSAEQKREARERFDRALELFNAGDDGGALAEFERAYALIPHPLVLYNIAGVHATMGRAVEATDAYDKLLANPGALPAEKLADAKRRRAEQAARVAQLDVKVNVKGASIELDGLEVAKTPAAPLRVTSGTRRLVVVARGHRPVRREVRIAGGRTESVQITLEPVEGQLATVAIESDVPDLEIFVDGEAAGKTPLLSPLRIAPGRRRIEARRAGYRSEERSLDVADGARIELRLSPALDAARPPRGSVSLGIEQDEAVVFVDGAPRGAYSAPLSLPAGRHRLRVERAGFFPFERDVVVPETGSKRIRVDLEPTAEYRAEYRDSAENRRLLGWIVTGAGAAVVVGSAGFLIWNRGRYDDARDLYEENVALLQPGQPCDPSQPKPGFDCGGVQDAAAAALDDQDKANAREVVGFTFLGVGAVAAGVGTVLLLTGDDPDRYEPRPESDVFGSLRPSVNVGPDGASLMVGGRF
ncbi:MAG: PEGA domain-containing protein [Polyangiaceae bacterium]